MKPERIENHRKGVFLAQTLFYLCFSLGSAAFSLPCYAQEQLESEMLPVTIEEGEEGIVAEISPADLQVESQRIPQEPESLQSDTVPLMGPEKPLFSNLGIPSLFFTYWQHEAIIDAKNSRGLTRAPTQAELNALNREEMPKPPPEKREIKLSGIVFVDKGEWTIWLNGERITPNAIPPEVMDLQVFKEYIDVKWLDEYTNKIFPVRLRPHQRFNMDTLIFLPG